MAIGLAPAACLPLPGSTDQEIVIDTEDFDVLLDRYTNSHRDFGCTLQLITSSDEAYAGFTDVISNAQSTIDIETLNFDDDDAFPEDLALQFAQLLGDRVRSGIRVRVMLDIVSNTIFGSPRVNQALVDGGVEVHQFQSAVSVGGILFSTHKKILIADGQRAIVGGSNYGYSYVGPSQWRDTNALLTGPIVTTLQHEFDYDWDNRSAAAELLLESPATTPSEGQFALREIDQKPSEGDFDINNAVTIGLRLAKSRVDIETPYFNPPDWMLDEMENAVDRGVQIRVLLNSASSVDIPAVFAADASRFEASLTRGVRIFLWNLPGRTIHAKAMVVDDSLAMIGSYNFDARSSFWDTENAIFSTEPAAVQAIDAVLQKDFAESFVNEIDLDWVASQPPCDQFLWDIIGLASPLL